MKIINDYLLRKKLRSLQKGGKNPNDAEFKDTGLLCYVLLHGLKREALALSKNWIGVNDHTGPDNLALLNILSDGSGADGDVLQNLIAAGTDVNSRSAKPGAPLYMASSASGNDLARRILIDAGADIDAADDMGGAPLHKAAYWGNYAAAGGLLKHGAKVNAANANGMTPLHLCVSFCPPYVMCLLNDWRADSTLANSGNETPLMMARLHILPDRNVRNVLISLLDEQAPPGNTEIITSIENATMIWLLTCFIQEIPDNHETYLMRGESYMDARPLIPLSAISTGRSHWSAGTEEAIFGGVRFSQRRASSSPRKAMRERLCSTGKKRQRRS